MADAAGIPATTKRVGASAARLIADLWLPLAGVIMAAGVVVADLLVDMSQHTHAYLAAATMGVINGALWSAWWRQRRTLRLAAETCIDATEAAFKATAQIAGERMRHMVCHSVLRTGCLGESVSFWDSGGRVTVGPFLDYDTPAAPPAATESPPGE